jgi:hypothetical protein
MSERGKSIMGEPSKQDVLYMFYPDQLAPSPHFGAAGASGISLICHPLVPYVSAEYGSFSDPQRSWYFGFVVIIDLEAEPAHRYVVLTVGILLAPLISPLT